MFSFRLNSSDLGENEMGLYMYKSIRYCKTSNLADSFKGIRIEVFMERPLMGNMLTQFLPTVLFLFIRLILC